MDRDDPTVKNRYSERLDEDSDNRSYEGEFPSMGVTSSVKKEWQAVNAYLPETLHDSLDERYRDLRYESGDQLQKGRHFYPFVIALGLERIEDMDINEVKDGLEELEV